MKQTILVIMMLLSIYLIAQPSSAAPDSSLLILGDKAEEGAQSSTSLDSLLKLESSGIKDPDLYYNIGVAYYRANDTGRAMLYFLRAVNLNSAHSRASQNISFIRDLSPDREMMVQRQFLESMFLRVYDWFNLNRAALAALFWLLITALCVHWLLHWDPTKERGLPTLILLISSLILTACVGLVITKAYRMRHNKKAVVASDNSALYSAPSESAREDTAVNAALIVIAQKTDNGFSQVILPDGSSAWIKTGDILKVIP